MQDGGPICLRRCIVCDVPKPVRSYDPARATCKQCILKEDRRVQANPERYDVEGQREKRRGYAAQYLDAHPNNRVAHNHRVSLGHVVSGRIRMSRRMEFLPGCNVEQLWRHIESKMLPGMTWENRGRGRGRWGLDHKVPLRAFDLADTDQRRLAFSHLNLQPLWNVDNSRKGARLPGYSCRR